MTSKGLDRIEVDECIELLRSHSFGRVGLRLGDEPMVLPVFYAFSDGDLLFRTDVGTKMSAAVLGTRIAFELDDVTGGWSVLVVGHATEVRSPSPAAKQALERLDRYWVAGERERVVRIALEKVSGRRLQRAA